MSMESMFTNLIGERGRADYAFNQWDNASFRAQLEALAEEHNVKSMLNVSILVRMILTSFTLLPYTSKMDEDEVESIFYQINEYALRVLAIGSRRNPDRKRKIVALSLQVKETVDWSHLIFKNCDLTKLPLSGEDFKVGDLLNLPHFVFEFKRPPTGTKYDIFTKQGYKQYYSHENSPLKVYVEESTLPKQLKFMDTCPDQVTFHKLKSNPDNNLSRILQSLRTPNVSDVDSILSNVEQFFVLLIPLYKRFTSEWRMEKTASGFVDFCYSIIKFTYGLELQALIAPDTGALLILLGKEQSYVPVILHVKKQLKTTHFKKNSSYSHFLSQYVGNSNDKVISIVVSKQILKNEYSVDHPSIGVWSGLVDIDTVNSIFMKHLIDAILPYKGYENGYTAELENLIYAHLEVFKKIMNAKFADQKLSSVLIGQLMALTSVKKFIHTYKDQTLKDIKTLIVYPKNLSLAIVIHCADVELRSGLKIRRIIPKLNDRVDYVIRLNIRISNHGQPNNAFDKSSLTIDKKVEFSERNGNQVEIKNDLIHYPLSSLSIQNLNSEHTFMINSTVMSLEDVKSTLCGFLMKRFIVRLVHGTNYIFATNRINKQEFLIGIFTEDAKPVGQLMNYYLAHEDQFQNVIVAAFIRSDKFTLVKIMDPEKYVGTINWCSSRMRKDSSGDCLKIEYSASNSKQTHIAEIEKLAAEDSQIQDVVANGTSKVLCRLNSAKRLRHHSQEVFQSEKQETTSLQVYRLLNKHIVSDQVSVEDLSDLEMIGSSGWITMFIVASVRGTAVTLRMMSLISTPVVVASIIVAFFAVDIFRSVKTVHDMNDILDMTAGEEWLLGLKTMFHYVDYDLHKEAQDRYLNNATAHQVRSILEKMDQTTIGMWFQPRLVVNARKRSVFLENNYLNLRQKVKIWSRTWPDAAAGLSIVAMDDTNSALTGEKRNKIGKFAEMYNCTNMIGFSNSRASGDSQEILVNLYNGTDTVFGDSNTAHIFVLGNGEKLIEGGNSNDDFILTGNLTYGTLDGMGGSNMLNITSYALDRSLAINFDGIYGTVAMKYRMTPQREILNLINITQITGREGLMEEVILSCASKLVNSKGGWSDLQPDHIVVPEKNCSFNSIIVLSPRTHVDIISSTGDLFFLIDSIPGVSYVENLVQNSSLNTYFIFNVHISDIQEIFSEKLGNNHNILISIYGNEENENATEVNILNVKTENVKFFFNDNASLYLFDDTVFVHQNTFMKQEEVLQKYPPMAEKLGAVMTIFCNATNTSIVIGHGKSANQHTINEGTFANVLPNDPRHLTHIVAGNGENIFVFNARHDEIYPKSEEIHIWGIGKHDQQNNSILLLDFAQQLKNVMGLWPKIEVDLESSNKNDIVLRISAINNENITFAKIILKNAALNNLYQKILLTMKRSMHIVAVNGTFNVEPKPMNFERDQNIILIKASQIEANTTIRVKRIIGNHKFVKKGQNLILTNIYDEKENSEEHSFVSLIFENFFANEREMKTLLISFENKGITLDSVIL